MSGTLTYVYNAPIFQGQSGWLVRSTDNVAIPCNLENTDYQQFLTWIAAGNTPPSGWTGPTNPTGASA